MKFNMLLVCAALAWLAPQSSLAFSAGEGTMTPITDNTWLYSATRSYTASTQAMAVPMAAVPDWTPRTSGKYLKYQVLINDKPVAGLESQAIVLSSATITERGYSVPAGESADFTLIAIITLPADIEVSPDLQLDLEATYFPITGSDS